MSDQDQIDSISQLLLEYSAGNYAYKAPIGEDLNDLDMIVSGINMLGEELESSNVSMEYFSSIFNAVSDLVVIVSAKGNAGDVNSAFRNFFMETNETPTEIVQQILESQGMKMAAIEKKLKEEGSSYQFDYKSFKSEEQFVFRTTFSKIIDRFGEFKGFLINLRDITAERKNENEILKAIFTAQQNEQKRVADDLHDSLGQELSVTKLMLSHLRKEVGDHKRSLELVETCNEIMEQSIAHLREICFNLMPGILTRGGLPMALHDLVVRLKNQGEFKVDLSVDEVKDIDPELKIAIYRIAQEFINNMIKHSNANELQVHLKMEGSKCLNLFMKENGQGFDLKKLEKVGENRGFSNLRSKTQAFNGELEYLSEVGKGTSIRLKFPV